MSGVRVNNHVTNKLIKAAQHEQFKHGDEDSIGERGPRWPPRSIFFYVDFLRENGVAEASCDICVFSLSLSADTYAMAGMALQCVKDAGFHVHSAAELNTALSKTKQKLLASRRADGHIGNEFSSGLAVQVSISLPIVTFILLLLVKKKLLAEVHLLGVFQALLAMGSPETEYAAAMEAMRTSVRCNTYHNPMAMSQVLPALNLNTYLTIKTKQCSFEDGMWLSFTASLWPTWVTQAYRNGEPCCRFSGAGAPRSCDRTTR